MEGLSWTRTAVSAALTALVLPLAAPPHTDGAPVRPVEGPVVGEFAPPAEDFAAGHRGVDLAAAAGAPVRAALAGTVTFAGQVAGAVWVTVEHGGGLRTTYGVLAALEVRAGQRVAAGEVLGVLAEGADHLDWGALRGQIYVDPLALLGRRGAHLVDPERLEARLAAARAAVAAQEIPLPGHAPAGGQGTLLWPVQGRITSGFGMRTHPISGVRRLHAGVDVAAPAGTPVVAAAAGTVTWAGPRGGYGLLVVVDHGEGLETRYAHASTLAVHRGDRVARGQVVAGVGATGTATGAHLHYEVRVGGVPQDPLGGSPAGR